VSTIVVITLKLFQPNLDLLNVVADTTNHGHYSLGPDAVYLLEAFKRHGVELAFEKLGVEGVHVSFEARNVHLSTFLGLHFIQFFRVEESAFECMVPDLAAFYTIDVLLRLRASIRVRSRWKGVDIALLTNDPTRFGTGFGLFWTGG